MTTDPLGMLLRAVRFAAEKHRAQRRKDSDGSPYINHPVSVAELLSNHGVADLVTLSAAVLHDTVEDTETSAEEIRRHFGHEVADVVLEVTDDKTLPKAVRKELQIQRAPNLSDRAKLVRLGDKACNAMDVGQRPPPDWDTQRRLDYLDWTERVVAGCRGVNPGLEAYYDEVVTAERRRIGAG
ncbi:MAG TPA: HD domain-containing protein [Longimicrobiales bacterium]|nr:HD domain-containing protein [Longimicrobiales bacterium]